MAPVTIYRKNSRGSPDVLSGGPPISFEALRGGIRVLQPSPDLHLNTLFVLNSEGRIVSTREPNPNPGRRFSLIRSKTQCAWAIHANVPEELAKEVEAVARKEPPARDFQDDPVHASSYVSLLGGCPSSGPEFIFPDALPAQAGLATITEISLLERNFRGWTADELPGRAPIIGVVEDGYPVSVCFCARRSEIAAEAGLETCEKWRGRGLAGRVTAAWALAVRAEGLIPIYSTSWQNSASLAVARKLGLMVNASKWNLG
jgi:hypothetical protein